MRKTVLFVCFLLAMLPGCAKRVESDFGSSRVKTTAAYAADRQDKLYVMSAWQRVTVKEVAAAVAQVDEIVQKTGGFVQRQSFRENEQADLKLRVPPARLRPTLDALADLGDEEYRSISAEDVTDQYVDAEARLKNAAALRDRLKALLSQAKDVKDILEIEKELTRIQIEVDSLEGRLKKLKGSVDLAEIDVTLKRKKILGPIGYLAYGIGWLIEKLFIIQ